MRYLILSDIHANLEALEASLAAAGAYDGAVVLGDLVGYGADPNAVIERVRGLPLAATIRGNHDKVAAGLERADGFNPIAREAIAWTASALTPEHTAWLAALPKGPLILDDLIEICHGTPFDEDMYVSDDLDAFRALSAAERPLCLYAHTHVPAAFRLAGQSRPPASPSRAIIETVGPFRGARFVLDVDPGVRYLVNCSAIGQPRDGDARAACGIVDTEARTVTILRVDYDVAAAQSKIVSAGLPGVLATRLSLGR